ncbi:MAG TPA: hypothetical protein VGG56_16270 [Terracidiphilus sp.]|jgi:hypothetical protein
MQIIPTSLTGRTGATALVAFCCLLTAQAQNPPATPAPPSAPVQAAATANLNDTLLARATSLYDSTAKSGLRSFDCEVRPDWSKIMLSSRKGAPIAAGDTRLDLLNTVKITLHGRIKGSSTLDWQIPAHSATPLDASSAAILDKAHRGIENTLQGVLKLWIPLVDGSVAESFGEEDAELAQTENGYTLRLNDKNHSVAEEFDRNLLLKQFVVNGSGSSVNIAPIFEPTSSGLLLSSFVARIQPAGAPAESAQQMHVAIEYQPIAGTQIPSRLSVEIPHVVQMDFAFDACTVNRP